MKSSRNKDFKMYNLFALLTYEIFGIIYLSLLASIL